MSNATRIRAGVLEPLSADDERRLLDLIFEDGVPVARLGALVERQLLRRITEATGSQTEAANIAKMNRGTVRVRLNME